MGKVLGGRVGEGVKGREKGGGGEKVGGVGGMLEGKGVKS